jgi:hypothetical protein
MPKYEADAGEQDQLEDSECNREPEGHRQRRETERLRLGWISTHASSA